MHPESLLAVYDNTPVWGPFAGGGKLLVMDYGRQFPLSGVERVYDQGQGHDNMGMKRIGVAEDSQGA